MRRFDTVLPCSSQPTSHSVKSTLLWSFFMLVALLLLGASARAQAPSPFQIANEVMTYEQSEQLSYLASTYGTDDGAHLGFSTHVDPAGHNFSFSLNPNSTYLGHPVTLTVSGTLNPFRLWKVTASGSYDGIGWTSTSQYVPPSASGYRPSQLHPCYIACDANIYYAGRFGFTPTCCFFSYTACETYYQFYGGPSGATDLVYCYQVDPSTGGPVTGTGTTTYSYNPPPVGTGYPWVWNTASIAGIDWGILSASGTSFSDGSVGSADVLVNSVNVSTTSFFNDLGTGANGYQCCTGQPVSGSSGGTSYTQANLFTATSSGSVTRIDLGVGYVSGENSFYAALYTNSNGLPGTELAQWDNLGSNIPAGHCCATIKIDNVSGLSLTAGETYFMVLGPEHFNGNAHLTWNQNSQGATGLSLYSTDGGQSWNSNGTQALEAISITSRPASSSTSANQFTAAATGTVSEIDVAVAYVSGVNSFYAALYTDQKGQPGTQLGRWDNLPSSQNFNNCCGLVSITGISGLSLSAGQSYFLVLGPEDVNSTTVAQWNLNTTGAIGLDLFSLDGGQTWNKRAQQTLGGFQVLGSSTFFNDLGEGAYVYQCCSGWAVSGSAGGPAVSSLQQ